MSRMLYALLVTALLTVCGACATAQVLPALQLLPEEWTVPGVQQDVIEVPPDHFQQFFAHIIWPGHEGERVHIEQVSWHWSIDPPEGAYSEIVDWMVGYCDWVTVCEPFPWNVVHIVGTPCTYITFQADVVFTDAAGAVHGPIWSNTVTKHIVPEPASIAVLGLGIAGLAGRIRRRR